MEASLQVITLFLPLVFLETLLCIIVEVGYGVFVNDIHVNNKVCPFGTEVSYYKFSLLLWVFLFC